MGEIKPTILVTDDEEHVRESIKIVLEDKYSVITAKNGKEAVDKVIADGIDLILMDIKMPLMDGLEALKRIKEVDQKIKVIMVTAYGTKDNFLKAMEHGAYDFIVKPFDINELLKTIGEAIRGGHKPGIVKFEKGPEMI